MTRLKSIQYLRLIAALAVVICHAQLHPIKTLDLVPVRLGSFGVIQFFVISGFIMVAITGLGRFDPQSFLRKRIERVVPLYWVVTLGVAALALSVPSLLRNTTFSVSHLVQSLLFIPYRRADGELAPLMKLGWSLNYEMFFYLLFAAFFFLNGVRRAASVAVVLALLVVAGLFLPKDNALIAFYTKPIVLSFAAGMAIGLWFSRRKPTAAMPALATCWGIMGLLFAAYGVFVLPDVLFNNTADFSFTLAGVCLIVCGLLLEPVMPTSRLGLLLGDASYSIYLVHMYFIAAALIVIERLGSLAMTLRAIPLIIISCAVGTAVHLLVEKPIAAALRRWHGSRRKAGAKSTGSPALQASIDSTSS